MMGYPEFTTENPLPLYTRNPAGIPVIGFAGWSGSGKTTLIEHLIPILKQMAAAASGRPFRIAVIKHDVHGIRTAAEPDDSEPNPHNTEAQQGVWNLISPQSKGEGFAEKDHCKAGLTEDVSHCTDSIIADKEENVRMTGTEPLTRVFPEDASAADTAFQAIPDPAGTDTARFHMAGADQVWLIGPRHRDSEKRQELKRVERLISSGFNIQSMIHETREGGISDKSLLSSQGKQPNADNEPGVRRSGNNSNPCGECSMPASLQAVLDRITDVDLILVEGFKFAPIPQIGITRAAHAANPHNCSAERKTVRCTDLPSDASRYLAVVTGQESPEAAARRVAAGIWKRI